jgi:outer membrane receptor protein involved in Fe transport
MMMNLGYVKIRGIDVSSTAVLQFPHEVLLNLRLSYTYQKAQDYTKRKSAELQKITYGGQIPYIPWNSGSAIAGLIYKSWQLNYSFIYVGERYHNSANIKENYEQPWYTQDMAIIKNLKIKNTAMRIAAEINNLLGQDYEVVLNYPMPERNYKISFTVEL